MEQVNWPLVRNRIRRGKVSNTFGEAIRIGTDGKLRNHQGWDFYAAEGTPCYAIGDGEVVSITDTGDGPNKYGVQLVHSFKMDGTTLYAFYAHLKRGSVLVKKGGAVFGGKTMLALTGNTGNATDMTGEDQHLHFEIRTKREPGPKMQDRISPLKVFKFCPLTQEVVMVVKGSTMLYNAGLTKQIA